MKSCSHLLAGHTRPPLWREAHGPPRAYCGGGRQELEAIRLKLWAMEHAEALPEPPCVQRKATEEERADVRQLLSPETAGKHLGLRLTLYSDG